MITPKSHAVRGAANRRPPPAADRRLVEAFALLVAIGTAAPAASAAPFGTFDARALGMGGAGVATSGIGGAAFHNPAALASQRLEDDFSLLFPLVGLQLADPSGLRLDTERFKDAFDAGDTAAASAALDSADGKTLHAEARLAAVVGLAARDYGAALVLNGYAHHGARAVKGVDLVSFSDSSLEIVGYNGYEIGIALARGFGPEPRRLAVGVVPKYVRLRGSDYSRPLTDFAGDNRLFVESAPEQTASGHGDLDVGVSLGAVRGWRLGVTGRNLFARDVKAASGRVIPVDPQWRVGLGYGSQFLRLAVDLDLTENVPVFVEQPTRLLAAGVEFNAFNFVQLRFGWQRNLADTGAEPVLEQYTAGLGARIWGLQADLAVIANDNAKGGMLQLGLRY